MHGIIFVAWEKYLKDRFHSKVLYEYHTAIGSTAPFLADHVYDDADLFKGVAIVSQITNVPVETLLREYGHYFIINGLVRHLRTYLPDQVSSGGRELLLSMASAHAQMGRGSDGIRPPLFKYQVSKNDPNTIYVLYNSPRKICSVLWGALEGVASYFHESVTITEHTCMNKGDLACKLEARFFPSPSCPLGTPEAIRQWKEQQPFTIFILSLLPDKQGIMMSELQEMLKKKGASQQQCRPVVLLQVLNQLYSAGLVANTANQSDDLTTRRYWRVSTRD
jgi:hypothetical protein